jgi:lipopolysaccharide transport system ATP-binding protein
MSELAIRVDNLSKRYRIGQGVRSPYKTLRESLMGMLAAPVNRLRSKSRPQINPDHIWALKDVSFEVNHGEVVGIIGRNGAGKTTLLKILSRITEPTAGSVDLYGRVGSLLEVGTGFHPELTGRENIFLNGAVLGMRRAEIERKFDEIVAFAEVEKFIDTPVKFYSSGMYVRLAFSVAAHLEPEILLVDEVLAVGDLAFQKKCLGQLESVASSGRTVLFVSHNMNAVRSLCSRSILLDEGHVELDSDTISIIDHYHVLIDDLHKMSGESIWEESVAPGDDHIRCLAIRFFNSRGECTVTYRADENIIVEFEYVIYKKLLGLMFQFSVYTTDGVDVFHTTDQNMQEPILFPGRYRARCVFPANLFNQRSYVVKFAGGVPHVSANIPLFPVITLQISGGAHGSYLNDWPGVVAPKTEWKTEKL